MVCYECPNCKSRFDPVDGVVGWDLCSDGYREYAVCPSCGKGASFGVASLGCAVIEEHLPGCGVIERRFTRGLLRGSQCMKCNRILHLRECRTTSQAADSSGGPGYYHDTDYIVCPTCQTLTTIGTHWEYHPSEC
jgi:hypothetical protein